MTTITKINDFVMHITVKNGRNAAVLLKKHR